MKTKTLKRKEALVRAKNYSYDNSKAKRKGITSLDNWQRSNNQHIKHLESLT